MTDFISPDTINLNKVHPIRDLDGTTTAQDIDDNFDHLSRALRALKELIDQLQGAVEDLEDDSGTIEINRPVTIIREFEESSDLWPMFAPGGSGSTEITADDIYPLGYWSPLTDGDINATEFIFASGVCIMIWVPTP